MNERRSQKGFTLIELMIVSSMAAGVVAAAGAFYMEVRTGCAAIEARLSLEREASLMAEWLGRDIRGARSVTADAGGVRVEREAASIRYHIDDGFLYRDDGERLLLGHVRALELGDEAGLTRVDLSLERPIGAVRIVSLRRSVLIGRRL